MYSYIKKIRLQSITLKNSTINLLTCSLLIALSGAFRVYLAALLLGTAISWITCLAGGLIIYSVYTLDRALDSKEDEVNRRELTESSKRTGLVISAITFLIGAFIFAKEGILLLAFLPSVTGFLYSKGIFGIRLKGGLGVKNLVVGLSWGAFIAGIPGRLGSLPTMAVFLLYGVKTFVNSTIDDFKDIKGDTLAGLRTLPICLGEQNTINILLMFHLVSYLVLLSALLYGVLAFEPIILAGSFLCGLVCIMNYTNEEKYISGKTGLTVFKDLESLLITLLMSIN